MRLSLVCLLSLLLLGGCDKDMDKTNCEEFRGALIADDKEKVRAIIDRYIAASGYLTHTSENLENLSQYITQQCSMEAKSLCFGCIKTLPEMSEILLTWQEGPQQKRKVIDISYTPSNNKMKFVALHD